ncbi:MAG: zinc-ribbon domain-containing protein [Proteobacteria bacterium]|nr:zinc-ribbon domain-containing protein [Pseudomonadota bacterium]
MTFSGFQLAKGTTFDQPKSFGQKMAAEKQPRKVHFEIFALLSLLVAVGGLGACFLKGKAGVTLPAIAGGIGTILLILMRIKLSREISKVGAGANILQLEYGIGYYLTILLFLASLVINLYSPTKRDATPPTSMKSRGNEKFCTQCGARNNTGNQFCSECGVKLM